MTLKTIANLVADGLDRPFDGFFINRIILLLVAEYNVLVKEELNKDTSGSTEYRVKYLVEGFEVIDSTIVGANIGDKKLLKSTNPLPKPLSLKRPQPFYYVGATDGSNSLDKFTPVPE